MNVCFLGQANSKKYCHRLNNLGMGWNFEGSAVRRMPEEVYWFIPLFKNFDHYGSVAELNVGDMVQEQNSPWLLAEQDKSRLDKEEAHRKMFVGINVG